MTQRAQYLVEQDGEHLVHEYVMTRDASTREEAIKAFLPLVKYVAGRINIETFGALNREDLYQYGILGLLTALDRFQMDKGASFKTFAYRRIHGEIIDAVRREANVGKDAYGLRKKIINVSDELRQQLGRDPALSEVADVLGLSSEEISKKLFKGQSAEHLSLNDSVGAEDTDSMLRLDVIRDEAQLSPDQEFDKTALKNELVETIKNLPERERLVLTLYYYEELTLADIGLVLGLSESRISQILTGTLSKIRGNINS